jgi:hypothetical protein
VQIREIVCKILSSDEKGAAIKALESIGIALPGRETPLIEAYGLLPIASACRVVHLPEAEPKDVIRVYYSLINPHVSLLSKVSHLFRTCTPEHFFLKDSPLLALV